MKTIETVAFDRYKSDQLLPERKRMNPSNYLDWANLGATEAQRWIPIEEEIYPSHTQILVKTKNGSVYDVVHNSHDDKVTSWWGSVPFEIHKDEIVSWRPIERL